MKKKQKPKPQTWRDVLAEPERIRCRCCGNWLPATGAKPCRKCGEPR